MSDRSKTSDMVKTAQMEEIVARVKDRKLDDAAVLALKYVQTSADIEPYMREIMPALHEACKKPETALSVLHLALALELCREDVETLISELAVSLLEVLQNDIKEMKKRLKGELRSERSPEGIMELMKDKNLDMLAVSVSDLKYAWTLRQKRERKAAKAHLPEIVEMLREESKKPETVFPVIRVAVALMKSNIASEKDLPIADPEMMDAMTEALLKNDVIKMKREFD